jgi:hypothetical protein
VAIASLPKNCSLPVAQDNNMGKSQKILVQSFIINILTIFVYYSLSHQPELTSYISTAIAKNSYPSIATLLDFSLKIGFLRAIIWKYSHQLGCFILL